MGKSKILTDLIYNKCSLEDTFLRLLVISTDLGDDEILEWIDNEQKGYLAEDNLPKYRVVRPILIGSYFTRTMEYTDKIIDISKLPEMLIEELESLPIYDSIKNIENINETQHFAIPPKVLQLLSYENGYNLYKASNQVVVNTFSRITSEVKNRLVKVLLVLEAKFGNLDEFDITDVDINKIDKIADEIKFIIFDKSISIGDNTTIEKSKIVNKE